MTDKLIIKKEIITEDDIFRIVSFILLFFVGWEKVPNHYFLIVIGFIIVYSIAPVKRFLDRNPQVIFDKSGIHYLRTKMTYSWEYIKEVDIEFRSSGTFKMAFDYKNSVIVLDLEKLKISPKEILDFVKTIDTNKLKDENKELKNDLQEILKNNSDNVEISNTFKKIRIKYGWIMGITFFVILGLAITLQVIYPYPYSFALGWSLMLVSLTYLNKNAESTLRDSEHIRRLTENQFDMLMVRFSWRQENDKKKKKVAYIAMFIITALIFSASYALSK
jgi:hypothetical protein